MRNRVKKLTNVARVSYEFACEVYEDRQERQRVKEAEFKASLDRQTEEFFEESRKRNEEYMAPYILRHQELSSRRADLESVFERNLGGLAIVTNFCLGEDGYGPSLYKLTQSEVGVECAKTLAQLSNDKDAIVVEAFMTERNSDRTTAFSASAGSLAEGFRRQSGQSAHVETSEYRALLDLSPYEITDRLITHQKRLNTQNIGYVAVCGIGDLPGVGLSKGRPKPMYDYFPHFNIQSVQAYDYHELAAGSISIPGRPSMEAPWSSLAPSPDRDF